MKVGNKNRSLFPSRTPAPPRYAPITEVGLYKLKSVDPGLKGALFQQNMIFNKVCFQVRTQLVNVYLMVYLYDSTHNAHTTD